MQSDLVIPSFRECVRRVLATGFFQTVVQHSGMQRMLIRLLIPPMEPALGLITAAEGQMKNTASTMEARFLESGNALEELSQSGRSLVENSSELVRLATGRREAEQIISETLAVLEAPLTFLKGYTEQLGEHTATLSEGTALLDRLLNFETDLQAAVAPLRAMRTMFRVEASRLPEADQAAFVDLSDQIEALHNQVRDTLGLEFSKLEETRSGMKALVRQLGRESARQQHILMTENARIAEELDKLNRQIDLNSQGEVQLTQRGQVVQGAVSRVVMTLQNQDIVAQRIVHLFEGIGRIRELGQEFNGGRFGGLDHLANLSVMVKIESGQLGSALIQLQETADQSGSATAEILATVDAMDQECLFLQEFSEVTAAANGTLQVLLDIVEEIGDMVDSAVETGMESLKQIQPVNSLTTQLSDSVERLSHQMNVVALNAQLQAVRIGGGTGLEVLAAHTAMVATETSRLGGAIRENFDLLRKFLKTEMESLEESCERGRVQQRYLEQEGSRHENRLHQMRDEILSRLQKIAEDTIGVRTNARRMADASRVSEAEMEGFTKMEFAFSDMTTGLAQALSILPADSVALSVEDCGYTMESERENHRKAMGGQDPVEEKTAKAMEEHEIELF